MTSIYWPQLGAMSSRSYVCGHCGKPLASERGWAGLLSTSNHSPHGSVYVCHQCSRPTFFDPDANVQIPGIAFGRPVQNVTDKVVAEVYEEARRATSAGCYTAAVLCCRKLLMHM